MLSSSLVITGATMVLYDQLAELYDILYQDYTQDIDFYCSMAEQSGGSILELGCGTGRTLIPIAQAGHRIIGLDSSQEMLDLAADKVANLEDASKVHLEQGTMTSFSFDESFSLVTVPFNTFLHLPSRNDQIIALKNIHQHLLPDGRVIIDLPSPTSITDATHDGSMVLERQFELADVGATLLQFSSTRLDMESQLYYVTWIYDWILANGETHRRVIPMTLRYLFPIEASRMFSDAGLELVETYGDFDQSPYDEESESLILVGVKR
ncbi:MAG: class I SAM-dependent methyltransferase [Chloroflexota bacterium]